MIALRTKASSASYSHRRCARSRASIKSATLMTVRSGWACLLGLSIGNLANIAIPVHVEQHGAGQTLVFLLAQDWIALKQKIKQILHDHIEVLEVLTLRDDLHLELLGSRLVGLEYL